MPNQPTGIKFFAPVIDVTINALMNAVDLIQKGLLEQRGFLKLQRYLLPLLSLMLFMMQSVLEFMIYKQRRTRFWRP